MSEWQDISTAPKDGTPVLLWSELWEMSWGIQLGYFEGDRWYVGEGEVTEDETEDFGGDVGELNSGPTHWMHLPEAPKDE